MTDNELVLIICLISALVADFIALLVFQLIERNRFRKVLHDDTITCKDIREARQENQNLIVGSYMSHKRVFELYMQEQSDNANEIES